MIRCRNKVLHLNSHDTPWLSTEGESSVPGKCALGTRTMYSLAQNIIPGEWLVTRPDLSGKTAVGYPMTCINISHCSPTLQIIVKVKFSLYMSRMHVRCLEIEPHAPAALPSQGYSRPVTH